MRRAPRSSLLAAALLTAVAAQAAPPSKEAATQQQLQDAEQARTAAVAAQQAAAARAAAAAAQSQRLQAQRDLALAQLHEAEAVTEIAADRMGQLEAKRKAAAEHLAKRAESLRPLLPLMERLSLYPAETLLAVPGNPRDRLRGLLVLQGLTHRLRKEALALKHAEQVLRQASAAVLNQLPKLQAARAAQASAAANLDAQIAASDATRQQAEDEAVADAKRAAALAAKAKTLRAMLATLEAQRRADEARAKREAARAERRKERGKAAEERTQVAALARPTGRGTLAGAKHGKGQLVTPVAGTVVRSWGDPTEAGPAIGISYHAAPDARVVSPCTGRVDFADPFRSYGLLMIVDCGGGYHAVLAGFAHLNTQAGQAVHVGQPIGTMPDWKPGAAHRPSLYVELRHGGKPVNPAPWLKASG